MDEIRSIQDELSTDISSKKRKKLFSRLTKVRRKVFNQHRELIDQIEKELNENEPIIVDRVKFLQDLPYGKDERSQEIMVIALRLVIHRQIELKLPIEIYDGIAQGLLADLMYAYIDQFQGRTKAIAFSQTNHVSKTVKIECGELFPVSKESVINITFFLKPMEFVALSMINHRFQSLAQDKYLWKRYANYLKSLNFIKTFGTSDVNFVKTYMNIWNCVFCGRLCSDGKHPPLCTNPENVIHPGHYNEWKCQYCHKRHFDRSKGDTYCSARTQLTVQQYEELKSRGDEKIDGNSCVYISYKRSEDGNVDFCHKESVRYYSYSRIFPQSCERKLCSDYLYYNTNYLRLWSCCNNLDGIGIIKNKKYNDFGYTGIDSIIPYPKILGCQQNICTRNRIPTNIKYYRRICDKNQKKKMHTDILPHQ